MSNPLRNAIEMAAKAAPYTYVVTAYNHRSETYYAFGPIVGEQALDTFLDQMNASGKWEEPSVKILNPPALCGTGQEISMEP
jgi:hypothetical protein